MPGSGRRRIISGMVRTVLCAIDTSELAPRVLRHAVGLASAMQSRLVVLHVGDLAALDLERQLLDAIPYGAPYLGDPAVRVERGPAVDVILDVADELDAGLIITGTRARAPVTRFLLGSTSAELLQRTARPVLLVSPGDLDVLTLSHDRMVLHVGSVLAAVDLEESNAAQLAWASHFAAIAKQPLQLMTVARDAVSNHDAAEALKARAHGLEPVAPRACIVRRGQVAEEIARCAIAEDAGLIVMGLGAEHRGSPGKVAAAVLEKHEALVLAVPGG